MTSSGASAARSSTRRVPGHRSGGVAGSPAASGTCRCDGFPAIHRRATGRRARRATTPAGPAAAAARRAGRRDPRCDPWRPRRAGRRSAGRRPRSTRHSASTITRSSPSGSRPLVGRTVCQTNVAMKPPARTRPASRTGVWRLLRRAARRRSSGTTTTTEQADAETGEQERFDPAERVQRGVRGHPAVDRRDAGRAVPPRDRAERIRLGERPAGLDDDEADGQRSIHAPDEPAGRVGEDHQREQRDRTSRAPRSPGTRRPRCPSS